MRLAFIEPHLNSGIGGIRRIIEVSNRLMGLGHEVTIFTPKGGSCTWLPNKVPIIKLAKMKRYSFDHVIFNLAEQYKHALVANAKHKIFWVLAPEATYKAPTVPVLALKQPFYFLANSKYTVKYIRDYGNVAQQDIPIISGGINPEHFKFDPKMPKTHHVLYFGSSRPWKGTALIESALGSIRDLKVTKMEGKNTPQHKMYTLYNSCNMYVSANQSEGFSFGQLEAFACGCPVVTTDDGGSRDYIVNGENALVVPRTLEGICNGVTRLIKNKDLMRKLRKSGIATARDSKFNWDNITTKFEQTLGSLG